mgnify:FL=1|tara:strand:- start:29 stop:367 length:339 start_codon:yes stop_codon:yes gene_type:complete
MKITKEMKSAVESVMEHIKTDYNRFMCGAEGHVVEMREEFANSVGYAVGNKYVKINNGGSVHSFVVNTDKDKKFAYGDILKTASWAAPARNFKRGNIFETESIEKVITWTGV